MKPDWFLVANASQARLLSREAPDAPLVPVAQFEHPQSRLSDTELGDAPHGRTKSDQRSRGTSFAPRTELHRKEREHFAREIADYLDEGVQAGKCRSLTVFAASPFLGELKAEFGDATLGALKHAVDLDLTHFGLSELEHRIAQALPHAG
ncbi:MAG: host attachment protein [Pseudomonadota bacterium]|uniref:Host attachment protein n=1 Tax=Caldimonas aquatica TaxID=376175 RepID=A0ABY6MNR2_9BURK|nr:host attachment protein [Schlegelella aquatica]UZD53574.1 host attachment protein [Schlegelella aquatica]